MYVKLNSSPGSTDFPTAQEDNANGGNPGGSSGRARQALNADTIRKEVHAAFRRGGRKAIDAVMKQGASFRVSRPSQASQAQGQDQGRCG